MRRSSCSAWVLKEENVAADSEEGDPQEVSPSGGLYCYFRDKLEPPSNPSLTIAPSNWVSTQQEGNHTSSLQARSEAAAHDGEQLSASRQSACFTEMHFTAAWDNTKGDRLDSTAAQCERVQWRTAIKYPQRGSIVLSKGLFTHIQKALGLPSHNTQNKILLVFVFCLIYYIVYLWTKTIIYGA